MERQGTKSPQYKLDPDSPTTKEACLRIGIEPTQLVKKAKSDFFQECENQKVCEMRYKNYLSRYSATIKSVFDERRVIMTKPQSVSVMASQLMTNNNSFASPLIKLRNHQPSIMTTKNDNHRTIRNLSSTLNYPTSSLPNLQTTKSQQSIVPNVKQFNSSKIMNSPTAYSPQIYFKIAQEYQKMSDDKMRNQEDLKNFLLTQRKNEERLRSLDQKLKKIEDTEKEQRKEMKEMKQHQDEIRLSKIQRVKQDEQFKDKQKQVEREQYNDDRMKKVSEDVEKEKLKALEAKKKLDKEIAMRELHNKKREELYQQEVNTCLSKLNEINNRLQKGNQLMNEKQDERKAYLKTQALLFDIKKEQAQKMINEQAEKVQEKVISKMTKIEQKNQEMQKDMHSQVKRKIIMDNQKLERASQNHKDILKQQEQYRHQTEQKVIKKMQRMLTHSMSAPQGIKDLIQNNSQFRTNPQVKDDDVLMKVENKKLKEINFQENMKREMKKMQFKKLVILEKEQLKDQKISQTKQEKAMIDKCKLEAATQSMKNKDDKMKAIMKLKGISILDKTEKKKFKRLAAQLVTDLDLSDIFKDDEKEAKEKEQ